MSLGFRRSSSPLPDHDPRGPLAGPMEASVACMPISPSARRPTREEIEQHSAEVDEGVDSLDSGYKPGSRESDMIEDSRGEGFIRGLLPRSLMCP
jgi:hypothetical protein